MTKETNKLLDTCKRCDAFFKEALDKAMRNQHVQTSQEAAFYILEVLVKALRHDPTEKTDKERAEAEKAIAIRWIEARHVNEFINIGDSCLMISGVWWSTLLRKSVHVDYYINMGRHSYEKVSEIAPKNLADIFGELSNNFKDIANILTEATQCISMAEDSVSNRDILRIYEVYLRTHNPFLAQKLKSLNINVVPGKTTIQ